MKHILLTCNLELWSSNKCEGLVSWGFSRDMFSEARRILTPQYGKFDWFNIFNIGDIFPHEHYQVTWLKRNRTSWDWLIFTYTYCCWLDVCFVDELVNMPYMDPRKKMKLCFVWNNVVSPNNESTFEHAFSSDEMKKLWTVAFHPFFCPFYHGFFQPSMEHKKQLEDFEKLQADSSTLVAFKGWWSETRADQQRSQKRIAFLVWSNPAFSLGQFNEHIYIYIYI